MILVKDGIEWLPPPVGTSDWAAFSRKAYCVDKTLMIKDLIDTKTRVALFTRPRRFGKTTAMRMIRAFRCSRVRRASRRTTSPSPRRAVGTRSSTTISTVI